MAKDNRIFFKLVARETMKYIKWFFSLISLWAWIAWFLASLPFVSVYYIYKFVDSPGLTLILIFLCIIFLFLFLFWTIETTPESINRFFKNVKDVWHDVKVDIKKLCDEIKTHVKKWWSRAPWNVTLDDK